MSLDLLEDINPADVAIKISDSPHYERLAPLPSYNDNESIKIERPEMVFHRYFCCVSLTADPLA